MKQIIPPSECPSCGTTLLFKNDQLFCTNVDCATKSLKAIVHFAKSAKIKGLGIVSIEKLQLTSIVDIYLLSEDECVDALGKNGFKVFNEIKKSEQLPLELLLPAFNIPLVGKSASAKLALSFSCLEDITPEALTKVKFGTKASANLLHWYKETYLQKYKGVLPFSFKFSDLVKETPSVPKGIVCISGKLKSFKTKALAEQALGDKGYLVKSSLTKEVDYLINESGIESTKTKKARETGTVIITDLNQFLGE